MIENPLFFTSQNKNGFCWKILSLNDLTLSPISRPATNWLQWQRANARVNLWWRHEPFPGETSIALRPCAGKAWVAKSLSDAWVSFRPTFVVNLASEVGFWKKFTLNRAQDVVRKPHWLLCILRRMLITEKPFQLCTWNIAQFLLGVGWSGMSYWV